MAETPRIVWSRKGEEYNYDSLGELIDSEGGEVVAGDIVSYGEAVKPSTNFIDVDDVAEMIADRAYDIGGEHAEGFPDLSDAAVAELSAFLAEWQAKYCQPTFWTVRNVQEYRITAEDLGGGNDD